MAITRFDDIPNLAIYLSADPGENTITKTGNNVDSVDADPGYSASGHPMTATSTGTAQVQHDPATIKIGQMAAFQSSDNTDAALQGNFTPQTATGDYTIVAALQVDANASRRAIDFTGSGFTGNDISLDVSTTDNQIRVTINNTIKAASIPWVLGTPYIQVVRWNNASGGTIVPEVWVDNVKSDPISAGTQHAGQTGRITLNNRAATDQSFAGRIGLVAYYDRLLTDQEVSDIHDLARHWVDNGEAPSSGTAPDITTDPVNQTTFVGQGATFSVVATGDPAPTYQWEANVGGWGNAETKLSDATGETTDTLTLNSTILSEDQAQVRCTATNASGSHLSEIATLTVNDVSQFVVGWKHPRPTFYWEADTGSGYGDATTVLSNASGQGTDTLTINSATNDDTGQVRCRITNPQGGSVTTVPANLTVAVQ